MSFAFTPDQQELRESAKRFLEDRSPSETVRRLMETETGFDEATWKQMAGLGWTGMAVPEAFGGLGFGFVELAVLLEEMGAALLPSPFLSSVVLGSHAILNAASDDQKARLLPGIADGTTRATLAFVESAGAWGPDAVTLRATERDGGWVLDGEKHYVLDGQTATLLVVAARTDAGDVELFVADPDADGVTRTPLVTLDPTRKQANIAFAGVGAERLGGGFDRTLDQAAAALAVEMVGGAQRCLDLAVDYAKSRIQFGRPIGSFQSIKHKCANMLIEVEMARSAAYYAAWAAANDPDELPVAACMAKAYCSDAFFHVAADTIQVHGGLGFTWEHDAHLYFRRAKSSEIYLGDASYHRELLNERLGV